MASFLAADSRPRGPTIDPDLREVANRVHEEFDDHVDPSVVDECLNQIADRFAGATVRSFIPLLVRRYVREELQTRLRQAPDGDHQPRSDAGLESATSPHEGENHPHGVQGAERRSRTKSTGFALTRLPRWLF
jgi:hypothetical protein